MKGNLSNETNLWPTFSRIIEHDKPQRTNLKGPQGTLKNVVQMIRSFLWEIRGRYKKTFQKKLFSR